MLYYRVIVSIYILKCLLRVSSLLVDNASKTSQYVYSYSMVESWSEGLEDNDYKFCFGKQMHSFYPVVCKCCIRTLICLIAPKDMLYLRQRLRVSIYLPARYWLNRISFFSFFLFIPQMWNNKKNLSFLCSDAGKVLFRGMQMV